MALEVVGGGAQSLGNATVGCACFWGRISMMRTLVAGLMVGLVACNDGPSFTLHDRVPCEQTTWGDVTVTSCTRACTEQPNYEQVSCPFCRSNGLCGTANLSFVVQDGSPDGVRGVCLFDLPLVLNDASVDFHECTSQH